MRSHTSLMISLLALIACSGGQSPITDCSDANGIHPICGMQNPEDLAPLAGGTTLVVSQFGGMPDAGPGNLALLDLETETVRVVFRGSKHQAERRAATPGWGDAACPGSPSDLFSPHGIDLALRPDGRQRLLVVNHGGRESVEAFEIVHAADDDVRIEWRGCMLPPEGAYFNDLVSLPDGGFLVTHMLDKENQLLDAIRASWFGANTGVVYEWQPDRGFAPVPGTESPFPNGIELSPDAREIYVNLYLANEVRRISLETGETLASAEVSSPDNSTWGKDGRLLVASHRGSFFEQTACQNLEGRACPFAFAIVSLDPETLEAVVVFENEGAPMGGATVAVDLGDELVMGSFSGDRVIRAVRKR